MVFRSIIVVLLLLAYFAPLIIMTVIGIRARFSKAYADKIGFRTKGDIRQLTLLSIIPVLNLYLFVALFNELLKIRLEDNTPLHK